MSHGDINGSIKLLAKLHHIRDQRHQEPLNAKFHSDRIEMDKIDTLLIDIDQLIDNFGKIHNVCDRRHQKTPSGKFHHDQVETNKIDNLLIDMDQ